MVLVLEDDSLLRQGQRSAFAGQRLGTCCYVSVSGLSEFSRRRDRLIALIAGVSVALLGGVVLAGWLLHSEALKRIIPGSNYPTRPNVAAGMLLCGAALTLLTRKTFSSPIRICAAAIATAVIILSALTVGEYVLGYDLGIEHWLIGDAPGSLGISHPGRMSPITALSFVLVGIALLMASQLIQKRFRLALVGGLSGALTVGGAVPLIGFFLETLFGPRWNYMGTSASGLTGALTFFLLGSGLLALLRGNAHLTWSLDGRTTTGFASGLTVMILAAGLTYNFTVKVREAALQVSHAQELLRAMEETEANMSELEREQRGYIITGNERLLEEWEVNDFALRGQIQKLLKLAADNSHQQPLLRQFAVLVSQRIAWANQAIEARRERGFLAAQEMVASATEVRLLDESRQLVQQIDAEEHARLHERQTQSEIASQTAFLMLPLGVFLCFAILSLGVFFLNSGMGERTQAENSLRQSEERMRAILESALDCVITMDHQGRVVEFNPAAEKTFGYRRDEAVGQLLSDLIIPPSLRERHQQGLSRYLATGEAPVLGKRLELSAVRRDGAEFPVELAITRIGSQVPPMFTGFIRDITERKRAEEALRQAEEKYRGIFENAVEGVFQTSPEGGYISVNPALARIYGYSSSEELMQSVNDIGHKVYVNPERRTEFKHLIEAEGSVEGFEYEVYRKDGSRIWLSENARVVRDENEKAIYYEGTTEDITERKQTEDALRASEAHLQTVVENLNEGVVVSDLNGEMLHWNRAALKIHGVTNLDGGRRALTELVDTFALSTMDGIPIPVEKWPLARILRGENFRDLELCVQNIKAGWYRTFNYGGTLVHDANNQPLMAIVTISDITERKQSEKTLREQAALFDQTYDAVLVWDWKGPITFWNRGAENLYGFTAVEAVDCTPQELLHTQIAGGQHTIRQSLDRDGVWEGEVEHTTSDGRQITVESRMVLVREPAREYVLETNRDITERKRGQERLLEQADIINRARNAIIIRNFKDDNVVFWNKGAERLYGWSAEEAMGRSIMELTSTNMEDREAPVKLLLSTGEFRGEFKQAARDGREIVVDCRATLVRSADGEPRSVLLINTDVTEQRKLEAHLLRTQRLESIGTLASGVAHDLNNILSPILMCAEMLKANPMRNDVLALVSMIEESAKRGAHVVKQVFTFARGVEGERVVIKPAHLIQEMIDIAQKTFPKRIEIRGHYADCLSSIKCDPTQLHQVLLNLSVNARDAMPNGGLITMAAENFDVDDHYAFMNPGAKPGPYVMFRVTDTGAGMTRATIDKIFDPFFTTKEIGKGTGLGLSTVLGIVKSHDGFISVDSEIGTGTTFKIFLPAQVNEENSQQPKTPPELLEGSGEVVLVVDDEAGVVEMTKMILEQRSYRVLTAKDGPDALAVIAQHAEPTKIVLTDMSMPLMDSIALIRAVKEMRPATLFIASTGQGEEMRKAELEGLGVKNFLTKPYNTQTLLTTVRDTLTSKTSDTANSL